MQLKKAPIFHTFGKPEFHRQIGRRYIAHRLLWPFDQTNGIATEIFAKTGIFKLFWLIETIKIKVIPV